MPEMDGVKLAERVLKTASHAQILLISGEASEAPVSVEVAPCPFPAKPFFFRRKLIDCLRNCCRRRKAGSCGARTLRAAPAILPSLKFFLVRPL